MLLGEHELNILKSLLENSSNDTADMNGVSIGNETLKVIESTLLGLR